MNIPHSIFVKNIVCSPSEASKKRMQNALYRRFPSGIPLEFDEFLVAIKLCIHSKYRSRSKSNSDGIDGYHLDSLGFLTARVLYDFFNSLSNIDPKQTLYRKSLTSHQDLYEEMLLDFYKKSTPATLEILKNEIPKLEAAAAKNKHKTSAQTGKTTTKARTSVSTKRPRASSAKAVPAR